MNLFLSVHLSSAVRSMFAEFAVLALAAIPAALLALVMLRMPDTARWYVLKGRVVDARRALQLVEPERDVEHELAEISAALKEEHGGTFAEMTPGNPVTSPSSPSHPEMPAH